MKITITAVGSRGDVQPHVALGRGLAEAGHEVRLAVDALFESQVRENGLEFAPISADPIKLHPQPVRQGNACRTNLEHLYISDIQFLVCLTETGTRGPRGQEAQC